MKRMIIAAALILAASQIAFAQDDKTKVDPQNVPTAQAPEQQKEEAQPAENKEQSEAQPAQEEKAAEQQTEGAKAE